MIDTTRLSQPLTAELEYGSTLYVPQYDAVGAVEAIEPGELEPYRPLLDDYLGRHERTEDVELIIANPRPYNFTIPRFFRWQSAVRPTFTVPQGNTPLPEGEPMTETIEATTSEAVPAPGGSTFHLGDRVRVRLFEGGREATVTDSGSHNPDPMLAGGPVVWTDLFANPTWIAAESVTLLSCPHEPQRETVPQGNGERVTGRLDDGGYVFEGLPVPRAIILQGYWANPAAIRSFVEEVRALPGFSLANHRAAIAQWVSTGSNAASQRGIDAWIAEPVREDSAEDDLRTVAGFLYDWAGRLSAPRTEPQPVPQGNTEGSSEWGPSHPEWTAWWTKARELAENFGYTGQYDTLAERLGGPARTSYDTVTVTITFPIQDDQPVTGGRVRDALAEHGFAVTDRHAR